MHLYATIYDISESVKGGKVVALERFYFDEKSSVLKRIDEKFGRTQEDEDTTNYIDAAPNQGFCLTYKLEPIPKLPQLGWVNVDEDADAKDWLSGF